MQDMVCLQRKSDLHEVIFFFFERYRIEAHYFPVSKLNCLVFVREITQVCKVLPSLFMNFSYIC